MNIVIILLEGEFEEKGFLGEVTGLILDFCFIFGKVSYIFFLRMSLEKLLVLFFIWEYRVIYV